MCGLRGVHELSGSWTATEIFDQVGICPRLRSFTANVHNPARNASPYQYSTKHLAMVSSDWHLRISKREREYTRYVIGVHSCNKTLLHVANPEETPMYGCTYSKHELHFPHIKAPKK